MKQSAKRDAVFRDDVRGSAGRGLPERRTESFPGLFPYTRGVHASMYRSAALDHANVRRLRTAVDTEPALQGESICRRGQGLSTAFDMPTLLGLDSETRWPWARSHAAAVAIDSLSDMPDLSKTST